MEFPSFHKGEEEKEKVRWTFSPTNGCEQHPGRDMWTRSGRGGLDLTPAEPMRNAAHPGGNESGDDVFTLPFKGRAGVGMVLVE